jgi:hypothetical protein
VDRIAHAHDRAAALDRTPSRHRRSLDREHDRVLRQEPLAPNYGGAAQAILLGTREEANDMSGGPRGGKPVERRQHGDAATEVVALPRVDRLAPHTADVDVPERHVARRDGTLV